MAAHRGKRLSDTTLNELTNLAAKRAHSVIGLSTQLVGDSRQQYALVVTVLAYLVATAAMMMKDEDDPVGFTFRLIETALKKAAVDGKVQGHTG